MMLQICCPWFYFFDLEHFSSRELAEFNLKSSRNKYKEVEVAKKVSPCNCDLVVLQNLSLLSPSFCKLIRLTWKSNQWCCQVKEITRRVSTPHNSGTAEAKSKIQIHWKWTSNHIRQDAYPDDIHNFKCAKDSQYRPLSKPADYEAHIYDGFGLDTFKGLTTMVKLFFFSLFRNY